MTLRIFKFYDAAKSDFAKAVFYGKVLGRLEYIYSADRMGSEQKIEFEKTIRPSRDGADDTYKEGFIYWWERYGSKMSIVTKSGFKFYSEELTDPTLLVNAITEALDDIIEYEHTGEALKARSNNFKTEIKRLHKLGPNKKKITEKRRKTIAVAKVERAK